MGASALSWPQGSGLHVQTRLDRKEKMWLNGTIEEQCLKATAGYANGKYMYKVISAELPR